MDIKEIIIDRIGLSTRSSNALSRAGIRTVGQMLEQTEESLSNIRNMGQKSVEEVLHKIGEYQYYVQTGIIPRPTDSDIASSARTSVNYEEWCESDEGKSYITNWLNEKHVRISALDLLSARAYNCLLINGVKELSQILFLSSDELMQFRRMDLSSTNEIRRMCRAYLKDNEKSILDDLKNEQEAYHNQEQSIINLLFDNGQMERALQYIRANDIEVEKMGLSVRPSNVLLKNGYSQLSDFILLSKAEMQQMKGMGTGSLEEIQSFVNAYLAKHENNIKTFCNGDDSAIWNKERVAEIVLDTFNKIGFQGLSLRELREKTNMPPQVSDEILKSVLGSLIAEGTLEYVDFRCYRVYPRFYDYVLKCFGKDDRTCDIILRRLQGDSLEAIGSTYGLSRERIRQIASKSMKSIRKLLRVDVGVEWFDEDYYKYFYETYSFNKAEACEWLGFNQQVYNYMEMAGVEHGTKPLDEAVDDSKHLDLGLRLKVSNYLHRNMLFLEGRWIEKTRSSLENYVVRKYCAENVSFEEFARVYNDFLQREEVPFDEDIYFTEAVKRTRESSLSNSRFLLWKQNRQIRYYDIDAQDYTELLDTLNLDAYENVAYSTLKFVRDYPEIMQKYDIRDQYELHNLLRKIIDDGAYHDFHCKRMPTIQFGTFDKDSAFFDIMINHAPITQADLVEIIYQEYGFDRGTLVGSYLSALEPYYHNGIYTIDQKLMSDNNREALLAELSEDFYYMNELRDIYSKAVPNADPEEINPYNLRQMGFSILSRFVYRNHNSLEAYFRDLLTREDITDITNYRSRFAYIISFSRTLVSMKNELEILEFEPNQIITFRKLAAAGITKDDLHTFCDEVDEFVEDGTYFSVSSLRKEGFNSELFELGFSDWFYASLLASDERFSDTKAFGSIILYKGIQRITIQSFVESLIQKHRSIDVYDLMTELAEVYGCRINDRHKLIYKLEGTDVIHDKYIDRLYANTGVYERELEAAGGL